MDKFLLAGWRSMDATVVLVALAEYAKRDPTFRPIKHQATTRWHASVARRHVELLLTGPKFWDTRAEKGGGGAVDLVMHLFGLDFKKAVRLLRERGI